MAMLKFQWQGGKRQPLYSQRSHSSGPFLFQHPPKATWLHEASISKWVGLLSHSTSDPRPLEGDRELIRTVNPTYTACSSLPPGETHSLPPVPSLRSVNCAFHTVLSLKESVTIVPGGVFSPCSDFNYHSSRFDNTVRSQWLQLSRG